MLEIIKTLLKDPAGMSNDTKYHVENWLIQEMYNQGDSQYRVCFAYQAELEKLSKQMENLSRLKFGRRWFATKEEAK